MSEEQQDSRAQRSDAPVPPPGVVQAGQPLQQGSQQAEQPLQQATPQTEQPLSQTAPQARSQNSQGSGGSLLGSGNRWLWFAGGVLFVLFGLLLAWILNLRKEPAERNEAIKWAAYGMLVGMAINVVTLYATGGVDLIMSQGASSSSSTGSIF